MSEADPLAIVEVLQQHFDELTFLCEFWQSAIWDPDYDVEGVAELEERIHAHADGLVLGGNHSLPLLKEGLASDEPPAAFAAAYTLLRTRIEQAAQTVIDALCQAEQGPLDGISQALCHSPIDGLQDELARLIDSAAPPVAAAAAQVLAFQGKLKGPPRRMEELLGHEDPQVRQTAWRTVALLG